jgi:hypothetical protein
MTELRDQPSVVSAEEVFAIDEHVRWVGLISARGDVIFSEMRAGIKSVSPQKFDEDYLTLAPLTLLGVAERFSPHLREPEAIVAWYGQIGLIHSRLGPQIIVISIDGKGEGLLKVKAWLESKKAPTSRKIN